MANGQLKSLYAQAIIPVALAVTGFVVLCCILLYSAMREDLSRASVQQAAAMAGSVAHATRHAMLSSDRELLATLVHDLGNQPGVDHLRIFNKQGVVRYAARPAELNMLVDKQDPGCVACHSGSVPLNSLGTLAQANRYRNQQGAMILAIATPIYNEPDCYTAQCHVHPKGTKVIGMLDLGLSLQQLDRSLATLRLRMVVFSLLVLLLTTGGVLALLHRSLFLPLLELTRYAADLEQGTDQGAPPRCRGALAQLSESLGNIARGRAATANNSNGHTAPRTDSL